MKKVLFISLVLMTTVCTLVFSGAQGESDGEQGPVTLNHFHWNAGPYNALLENAALAFEEEHPNVTVNLIFIPDSERPVKIKTALAADGDMDSCGLMSGEAPQFLSTHQMLEIVPAGFGKSTVQEVVDMWHPGSIQTLGGVWDGKYYGIPFELSNYVMWVNKQHMLDAGLDPETDVPETWEEFVTVAKKMTVDKDGVRVQNGFSPGGGDNAIFLFINTMMQQKGLDWATEKGFLASLDDPSVAEVIDTFTSFMNEHKIWDPTLFDNEKMGFGTGLSSIMLTGGTWFWGVIDKYGLPREDVICAPYPRFKDGPDLGGNGYGYNLYVTRLAKDPELSFALLDAFTSQPNEYIKMGLYQPRKSMDPEIGKEYVPAFEVFDAELKKTTAEMATTHLTEITDLVGSTCSAVMYGGSSVEEAIAQIKKNAPDVLSD